MPRLIKDKDHFRQYVFNANEFKIHSLANALAMCCDKLREEGNKRKGLETKFYSWDELLISDFDFLLDSDTLTGDITDKSNKWIRESLIELNEAWTHTYAVISGYRSRIFCP